MILADKIILLRKRAGWSQEEFAQRLDVTRQAVSKWEGAQSVPDLERVLRMAQLFDVSTDFLLKDEYGEEALPKPAVRSTMDTVPENETAVLDGEHSNNVSAEPPLRRVTMEEANAFLSAVGKYSSIQASAIMMYVLSPVPLLTLSGLSERTGGGDALAVLGIVLLLLIVAAATVILIGCGHSTAQYEYLEKEDIDTDYGVDGLAREYRARWDDVCRRGTMYGVGMCILAALPVICAGMFPAEWGLSGAMVGLTLVSAAVGVRMLSRTGLLHEACDKLLEENDYTREKKRRRRESRLGDASGIYWLVVTAGYLLYSFVTEDWERSWIVWPVAGVLYAAFAVVWEMAEAKSEQKHR